MHCPFISPRIPRHPTLRPSRPDQQHCRVAKLSNARKGYTGNGPARLPSKGPSRRKNLSFPMLRSQFSAMSVEDRLQFLSWLFECAL
ncbi:hypothetical protein BDV23DRAFT_166567 [Aspergillus alliaceus]|uniref:Uncharacterized protein n=1 Tax=Petromyces alliaceus TaxID=209559 RepID=A0A5N6FLK4_PETAA|nr:uncharacterized protein BDW43DRAFT_188941 [Aspergillus alliaceus]KAB8229544.1 hypothetical protein BDW43DRAFT_188941 [Aspergillus alliaceus]KAE8384574.1 hypothetical protein BDV23DRAFT_166567 [Aspergillus alliaceus]